MSHPQKPFKKQRIYIIYILLSCFITVTFNSIHSYIINTPVDSSSFIMPLIAGILFGYLLAKNKLLSKHLKILADTDLLTGLLNRSMFIHLLKTEILKTSRYGGTFSVIFIDIDHFKSVNDQHGHQAGDKVLSDFSQLIMEHNRISDISARYGGEEFVILSTSSDIEATTKHAERLRTAVANHHFETAGHITCSFGIAEFKKDEDNYETLLKRADEALYDAKQNGRNRIEVRN